MTSMELLIRRSLLLTSLHSDEGVDYQAQHTGGAGGTGRQRGHVHPNVYRLFIDASL